MIIKSSCRDSRGLGAHLEAEENEIARLTQTEGVLSLDTESAVTELVEQGAGSRTRSPLVHASISPQRPMTDEQWERAWDEWERARGLQGQAFVEVEHRKKGRSHRHRVYSRVDLERQSVIKQSHEKRINERVARSLEIEFEHDLVPGRHNRAVQRWAEENGRPDLAAGVAAAADRPRPRAQLSHNDWQQQERTGVDLEAVTDAAFDAWRRSDSLDALESALGEHGLALAAGRKTAQLVDQAGECHDLRRTLTKRDRGIRAADVKSRAPMDQLAPVHEVSESQRAAGRTPAAAHADVVQGPDGQPVNVTQTEQTPADPVAAEETSTPGRADRVLGRPMGSDDEAAELQSRLDEIDQELERVPAPPDREQVRADATAHAQRECRIRLKSTGEDTTLDELDDHAADLRSKATKAREGAEDMPRWRFIERIRASRRARAAELRADRAEQKAVKAREFVEQTPELWKSDVDDALARHDERVERRQRLEHEHERDELAQRVECLKSDPRAEHLHDMQARDRLSPGPDDDEPDTGPRM
ncbi:relaxase/mobilization nuclease domain-containing protein [Halofilum ochraceum]|uniref:relaxase/mobilization nuclease domain-containing protein n=1 Tax=Halofilum ochraceum TaxID=1611323 RepID=UPI0008333BA9|nr:hypothetical protein [Halofilum ochraceum]